MRFFSLFAIFFTTLFLATHINRTNSMIPFNNVCKPCNSPAECERKPDTLCLWGETRDYCNRRVCSKGPGEFCGGAMNQFGDCGEGMMCKSDNRCHGCSIETMSCY